MIHREPCQRCNGTGKIRELLEGQAEKLQMIRSICTGESQVADDDTEALQYIVDLIDGKGYFEYTDSESEQELKDTSNAN